MDPAKHPGGKRFVLRPVRQQPSAQLSFVCFDVSFAFSEEVETTLSTIPHHHCNATNFNQPQAWATQRAGLAADSASTVLLGAGGPRWMSD